MRTADLISIRAADDSDAVAVIALWTSAYVDEGEGGRTEPYAEADFRDAMRDGNLFVADLGGSAVGVVALAAPGSSGRAVAEGGEAELRRLAVAAPTRGGGIGSALVERCEELAREEGWPAIALWSREYQTAAHRLYESFGYERQPDRDTTDETGHSRLVFRLTL